MKQKIKEMILTIIRTGYLACTFFLADAFLRVLTRWIGAYSIFELAPNLFSALWALLLVAVLSIFPRKAGRRVYIVLYTAASVFALCQYGYYLIFDKFFYLSDIANAGEGAGYAGWVLTVLNKEFILMFAVLAAAGAIGVWRYPDFAQIPSRVVRTAGAGVLALFLGGQLLIPKLYALGEEPTAFFVDPEYEYGMFTNSAFDMELTGMYQYVFRDATRSWRVDEKDTAEKVQFISKFLSEKPEHRENEMTGILEGKNLIVIQMESIDDWLVTPDVMPTVYSLMEEGIHFTNFYAPTYSSGGTFNTEFAFNTSTYPGTQGTMAYSYTQNSYPYSIAAILRREGYCANSFHENSGTFYNRENIHSALGYESYIRTKELLADPSLAGVDDQMILSDDYWQQITGGSPFYSFLISISAHIPYDTSDPLAAYAVEKYPAYLEQEEDSEVGVLKAKARLTDDMFAVLLRRLEEDGLLKNTVIMAYADHYAYGLSDKELLQELSEEAGSGILERVPAFIWYEGCEPMEVDKVCQTIDWVPTLANMFDENVVPYVMGNDIFDPAYAGYAVFPNGTWLTKDAYVVNGLIRWNNGMTDDQICEMNEYVRSFYEAN